MSSNNLLLPRQMLHRAHRISHRSPACALLYIFELSDSLVAFVVVVVKSTCQTNTKERKQRALNVRARMVNIYSQATWDVRLECAGQSRRVSSGLSTE